ncbi:MAG TPA: hypothetical protein VE076_12995 [Nitrososphaeraceae archaeon]|nr:hypothetical protein [Nitrososphaeraceae archaeon]
MVISPSLALSIPPVGAKTNNSNVASKLSPPSPPHPSSPPPAVAIRFDTNTKIKDIIAIHNQGIPFDKYIEKISQDMKNDTISVGQIRAWNFIESMVRINADICSLQQSQQQQQQKQQQQPVKANDIQAIVTMMSDNRAEMLKVAPLPSKNICDAKMSFAYEVCQGDPTITECKNSTQSASKAINNYIKTNNLHNQTNNLAFQELEKISATLNHSPD